MKASDTCSRSQGSAPLSALSTNWLVEVIHHSPHSGAGGGNEIQSTGDIMSRSHLSLSLSAPSGKSCAGRWHSSSSRRCSVVVPALWACYAR